MTNVSRAECEAVVRRLWPHLDGVLPEHEQDRITSHLARCVDCRSHFEFSRAFLDAVGAAHPDEPTDAVRAKVLAALAREGFTAAG